MPALALCLFILVPTHLPAQVGNAPTPAARVTEAFSVQPGDLLRITVWPQTALGGEYPVEESGLVFVPILGAVQVSGLALDQVRTLLRDGFSRVMQSPVVTVVPLFNVSVLGAVIRPGLYQVDPSTTVFDVISLAGGLHPEAEEDGVVLVRGDRSIPLASTEGLGFRGDADMLKLRSGDRIMVRRRGRFPLQAMNVALQGLVLLITIISVSR